MMVWEGLGMFRRVWKVWEGFGGFGEGFGRCWKFLTDGWMDGWMDGYGWIDMEG